MWPFSRPAPKIEAKSLANPTPEEFSLFGVVPVAAGVPVTVETALKVPAVASAIRVISEAAATLDVMVKEVGADGTERDAPNHSALKALRRPNDWTEGFGLIADLVSDALIDDNGGCGFVSRTGDGRIVEIVRYRRGVVQIARDGATDEPSYTIEGKAISPLNLLHVRPPLGRAPLSLAREAIGVATILDQHVANLFARGAHPSGVLMFPKGMGEEAVRKAKAGWRAAHEGPDASGRTAILHDSTLR